MHKKWNLLFVWFLVTLTLSLNNSAVMAQGPEDGPIATVSIDSKGITWLSQVSQNDLVLTISGPEKFYFQADFAAGSNPFFGLLAEDGQPHSDGAYTYELVTIPLLDDQVRQIMDTVLEEDRSAVEKQLREAGKLPEPLVQSGYFFIGGGVIIRGDEDEEGLTKDQQFLDDLIVVGSVCAGQDCVNGESFGFDTIRLKENNLRIKAQDTSTSASFPTVDWQLTFNDSANGGLNKFSIDSIDNGATPFTIEYGAASHSLYVDDAGRLGLGTSAPVVEAHIKDGDTPTLRLEQDGSSGFTPQTWDVAGNEAGFFIRDATNGSTLPFRIRPGAPSSAIDIAADGDVGLGTSSPAGPLHVVTDSGDFLVDSNGNVGLGTNDIENWKPDSTVIESLKASLFFGDAGTIHFFSNAYAEAGGVKYKTTDTAANYYIYNEQHVWRNAPLGTIDTNITWTERMRLDSSGNLQINGALAQNSDVKAKENFRPVDGTEVLTHLAEIPITAWNFKDDDPAVRHLGPMAQDFYAAFGLGQDERHIAPLDTSGVALAAIQTLHQMVQEKDDQIAQLQKQNDALETRLEILENLVKILIQE